MTEKNSLINKELTSLIAEKDRKIFENGQKINEIHAILNQ